MEQRRSEASRKFAAKYATSDRFSKWFRLRPETGRERSGADDRKYLEARARTERYLNTPLKHM